MRLENVSVSGDSNTCDVALLDPGTSATCSMSKVLSQADFDIGYVTLQASGAAASPRGPDKALPVVSPDSATVPLNQTAALDVSAVTSKGFVTTDGDSVLITFTAGNIGSVTLQSLHLMVSHNLTNLTCDSTAATLTGGSVQLAQLAVDSVVQCTGQLVFDQDALEAGTQVVSVEGSASSGTNLTASAGSAALNVVPYNRPGLSVKLSRSCNLPAAANGKVTCPVLLKNTGNVRLANVSVIAEGAAETVGCAVDLLGPGATVSCSIRQAVSQEQFDTADQNSSSVVAVGVSAYAVPKGSNHSALQESDAAQLQLQPVLLRQANITSTETSPASVMFAGAQDLFATMCASVLSAIHTIHF